jgi:hypothetical protein
MYPYALAQKAPSTSSGCGIRVEVTPGKTKIRWRNTRADARMHNGEST